MAPTEDTATSPSTKQTGFYPFFGVDTPFDPKATFVTARFLPPLAFGIIRLIFGLYAITATIVDIVLTGTHFRFSESAANLFVCSCL